MSNTIDNHVVNMDFKNKDFQSRINETIKALQDLKKGLKLDGADEGFKKVKGASKDLGLEGIQDSLEQVNSRFSTMGVIGMAALSSLTNSALNFGKTIIGSILDPILKSGKQRALNIEQAKFQFKGLGMAVEETMEDAKYAVDGTAYTLDAAAKVAAQLGASGMRAGDQMRASLRAVSGVAAMTGSSYEDVGNIFTKVAGQGRLMGDDLLRLSSRGINAAAVMAKEMGKTEAEVRDLVTAGKIGFEDFANAMDSAFGEHAMAANDTFMGSMANIKASLSKIGERLWEPFLTNMIPVNNAIRVQFNQIRTNMEPFFEWWENAAMEAAGSILIFMDKIDLSSFENTVKNFGASDKTLQHLKDTFQGVASIAGVVKDVVIGVAKAFGMTFNAASPLLGTILSITAAMGRFVTWFIQGIRESQAFSGVMSALSWVLTPLKAVLVKMGEVLGYMFDPLETIDATNVNILAKAILFVRDSMDKVMGPIKKFGDLIGRVFGGVVGFIKDQLAKIDFGKFFEHINIHILPTINNLLKIATTGGILGIVLGFKKFVDGLTSLFSGKKSLAGQFKDFIGGSMEAISGTLDAIKGVLVAWQTEIKTKAILNIAIALGILAVALVLLSGIDSVKLATGLAALGGMLAEVFGFMWALEKMDLGTFGTKMTKLAFSMIPMAIAILILSSALKKLSEIPFTSMVKGLLGLAGIAGVLVGFTTVLDRIGPSALKGATKLIAIAIAIQILASAVKKLSQINSSSLLKGIGALAVIMAALSIFINFTDFNTTKAISTSIGIGLIAVAIRIMVASISKLAEINSSSLLKAGIAFSGILLAIGIFTNTVGGYSNMISTSIGITILSAALLILVSVVKKLADIPWKELAKGLGALAVMLLMLAGAMKLMDMAIGGGKMIAMAIGLTILGAALLIITKSVENMGSLSLATLAKGLISLALALLMIVVAANAMTGALAGAAAMIVMAVAIKMLVPPLERLGKMTLWEIIKMLLALTGAFIVIGAAGFFLGPLSPLILAFAAAVAVLGLGLAAIGAGMFLFGTGLTLVAAAGKASVDVLIDAITRFVTLIPNLMKAVALAIIELIVAIGDNMPRLIEGLGKIASGLVKVFVEIIPELADALATLLVKLTDTLSEKGPEIIENLGNFLVDLLDQLNEFIPQFVEKSLTLIAAFLDGIAEAWPQIVDSAWKLVIAFIDGITDGINNNQETLRAAIWNLIVAISNTVTGFQEDIKKTGDEILQNIAKGMGIDLESIKTKAKGIVTKAVSGITEGLPDVVQAGKDFVAGMISGIGEKVSDLVEEAKTMASKALNAAKSALGINSPSKKTMVFGRAFVKGMNVGIEKSTPSLKRTVKAMSDTALGEAGKIGRAMKQIFDDFDPDMQFKVKPVLDDTDWDPNLNGPDNFYRPGGSVVQRPTPGRPNGYTKEEMLAILDNIKNGGGNGYLVAATRGEEPSKGDTVVNFTQNNNSPKALSASDIYRQSSMAVRKLEKVV